MKIRTGRTESIYDDGESYTEKYWFEVDTMSRTPSLGNHRHFFGSAEYRDVELEIYKRTQELSDWTDNARNQFRKHQDGMFGVTKYE